MCNRCEALEEQIAYLKSELGQAVERTQIANVSRAFGLTPNEAWIVVRLNRAGGRVVTYNQLLEELPSPMGNEDRLSSNINTVVCRIRAKTAPAAIETAWGLGLRSGPWLAERLPEVLAA